jgi:hypothetical protein
MDDFDELPPVPHLQLTEPTLGQSLDPAPSPFRVHAPEVHTPNMLPRPQPPRLLAPTCGPTPPSLPSLMTPPLPPLDTHTPGPLAIPRLPPDPSSLPVPQRLQLRPSLPASELGRPPTPAELQCVESQLGPSQLSRDATSVTPQPAPRPQSVPIMPRGWTTAINLTNDLQQLQVGTPLVLPGGVQTQITTGWMAPNDTNERRSPRVSEDQNAPTPPHFTPR